MKYSFILVTCAFFYLNAFSQIPRLLKDISPGNNNSINSDFRIYNFANSGLFIAGDGVHGKELWKTDGTVNGTILVSDIYPGLGSSFGQFIDTVNGYLICRATDSLHGVEFFSLDNNLNPQLLGDINPGFGNAYYEGIRVWNNNGIYYFLSGTGTGSKEIWMTDGTVAGTRILLDISPGPRTSTPYDFTPYYNNLLFTADDSVHGREIWITDGTTAGTRMLKNINPNAWSVSSGTFKFKWNDVFYFDAIDYYNNTCTPNSELWRTDGTTAGTYKVKEVNQYCNGSYPSDFFSFKNNFYFSANSPPWGREIWKSDGTDSGTVLMQDINPSMNTNASMREYLWQDTTNFYFIGNENTNDNELWKSDGVNASKVIDIYPGPNPGIIECCYDLNNFHFFIGNDSLTGKELWVSDGTLVGTFMLADINPGAGSSIYNLSSNIVWENNQFIFFEAFNPAYGYEIWKTDGTNNGTSLLKDITPGPTGTYTYLYTEFNHELFFIAQNSLNGKELWKTDGSPAGTRLVKDIIPGPVGAFESNFSKLDVFRIGSHLYFTAGNIVSNNIELWRTDGSDIGTTILTEIYPDTIGSFPQAFNKIGRAHV